ncbi:uncharacterized protein CTRU02_213302 [Colletotrichum truncatum]|uniref:Uncharacterized protein n=1 Tax=Colletotrichum truncatum TaxID=5467 RepID=A0ACC3YKA9_COLTU
MTQNILPLIQSIETHRNDKYQDKVIYTYDDPPEMWHKALGENLSFQFGLFDEAELNDKPKPGSIGTSEFRQAGACRQRQLDYCAEILNDDIKDRINLYFCNGQDVDLLPVPEIPYDLVVVRGVCTHFLHDVFETSVAQVAQRMRKGGILIISDTLYRGDINKYKSPIPDKSDRLACSNRKTPEYFAGVLENSGFTLRDMRIMPSNAEVIHWFQKVQLNIEQHFPNGVTGPIQELHEMALSFTKSLAANKASVYSIIAQRNN